MRSFFGILLLVVFPTAAALAGSIVLEGKYQQRNIYVVNPIAEAGVGFCVYEVNVNGEITTDEINSQAFEIDLSIHGFKMGDAVTVVIKYKDGCEPRVLNPGALEPQPTFECTKIESSTTGMLMWETTNEVGKIPYQVQQFKWNKWVTVGEVMGNGTSVKNNYQFQGNLTTGLNKFRVAQKSYEGNLRKSPTVEVVSPMPAVTYSYNKKLKAIEFSVETFFELYNVYGQIIKRGFGKTADLSILPKGDYYLSYDNKTEKFVNK
ncbi:MAG: hypothetical protein SH856_13040 [Flavobacteriales bacterium]|nr:hypothetical protein [Flavobacteriales bacterium]